MLRHKLGSIHRASQSSSLGNNGGDGQKRVVWAEQNVVWAEQNGEQNRRNSQPSHREHYTKQRVDQLHPDSQPISFFAKYKAELAQRVRRGNQPSTTPNEYHQAFLHQVSRDSQPDNKKLTSRTNDSAHQHAKSSTADQLPERVGPAVGGRRIRRKHGCRDLAQSACLDSVIEDEDTKFLYSTVEKVNPQQLKKELTTAQLIAASLRGVEDWHNSQSNNSDDLRKQSARFLYAKQQTINYLKSERKRHELRARGIRFMLEERKGAPAGDQSQLSSDLSESKSDKEGSFLISMHNEAQQLLRYREDSSPPSYSPVLESYCGGKVVAEHEFVERETTKQRFNSVVDSLDEQIKQDFDRLAAGVRAKQQIESPIRRPRNPLLVSANTAEAARNIGSENTPQQFRLLPTVFTGIYNPPPLRRHYSLDGPSAAVVAEETLDTDPSKDSTSNGGNNQEQQLSPETAAPAENSVGQLAAVNNVVGLAGPKDETVTLSLPAGSRQKNSVVHIPAITITLDILSSDPVTPKNNIFKMEGVGEYQVGSEDDEYEDIPDEEYDGMGESGAIMDYVDSDGDVEQKDRNDTDAVPVVSFNPIVMGLKEINGLAHFCVSSYKPGNGVLDLMSDDLDRYWQSDGVQPHRLTMTFVKAVEIRSIRFYVNFEQDESYTPTRIEWLAGTSLHDLHKFATSTLLNPRDWIDVPLAGTGGGEDGNSLVAWVVQMVVLENHQNGKDTHIRGLRVYSFDDQLRAAGPRGSAEALEKVRREEFRVDETKDADENEKALVARIRAATSGKDFSAGDPLGTASSLDFMQDPQLR